MLTLFLRQKRQKSLFSALAGLVKKKEGGGGVTLSHSKKSCAAVSDEQQKLVANLKGQCAIYFQPPLLSKAYNKKERCSTHFHDHAPSLCWYEGASHEHPLRE